MLAKCSYPSCSASFRHLAEGKLFRLEIDTAFHPSTESSSNSHRLTEYFWLCARCSVAMTLRLSLDGRVVPASLLEASGDDLDDLASVSLNRRKGLLFCEIDFNHSRTAERDGDTCEGGLTMPHGRHDRSANLVAAALA